MIEELPKNLLPIKHFLNNLTQKVKKPLHFFKKKPLDYFRKNTFSPLSLLNLALIAFIVTNAGLPSQNMISPVKTSMESVYIQSKVDLPKETFAFVPDLAPNKFPYIDLSNLTYLSFFDIPLTEDGKLNYESLGYQSFTSDEASQLFERARYNNTKVFLTLSAFDTNTISNILNNEDIQNRLADQIATEISSSNIDGILIDFEYPGKGKEFQDKFSKFIILLNNQVHQNLPESQIAVAIPNSLSNNQSLYNTQKLAETSDKVFIIADDFSVLEYADNKAINPVYGGNFKEYWNKVSASLRNLNQKVPKEKLVMERAWYGNGNQYKLYIPNSQPPQNRVDSIASSVNLDQSTIDRLVYDIPSKGQSSAREYIPLIAEALNKEGILNTNVLAYALATIEHETDGTFAPIHEIKGSVNARRLGYEGSSNYFGRGFIQITHLRNYYAMGQRIGMGEQLTKNPELASDPKIAASILAAYFKDNNVSNLATQGSFVAARRPINPDLNGWLVADMAVKYTYNL